MRQTTLAALNDQDHQGLRHLTSALSLALPQYPLLTKRKEKISRTILRVVLMPIVNHAKRPCRFKTSFVDLRKSRRSNRLNAYYVYGNIFCFPSLNENTNLLNVFPTQRG